MKWIVLAILLFVGGYSFVTLYFRKEGDAYQPYHDAKEKATLSRLKSAGFRRITAAVGRPAVEGAAIPLAHGAPAEVKSTFPGLSAELKETLIDQPNIPEAFHHVRAVAVTSALLPYTVQFSCALADHKQMLAGAFVYLKEGEIAIVTQFEAIEGELLARTRDSLVQVTIPSGTLPAGNYNVSLIGSRSSTSWTLQVH